MRFLLVNPYYPIDETPSPPLGLAFIAAALEQSGIEVKLLDFVVYPYSTDVLEKTLLDFSPEFVGVTSVTMSFLNAVKVIKDVKRIAPDVYTIMGGPHVTFNVDETLTRYPVDFIVLGEGEETVVELATAINNNEDLNAVKGIAYRDNMKIVHTGFRDFSDINTFPIPARHFIPLGRYRALGMPISMTSSRGCPFKCIFCVGRKMVGAKVRYRDPRSVVDEMVYLHSLGFHQINLADDLFTANKRHCHAVCDEILKRELELSWTSFARVDTVSEDVLKKMKQAGCHTVSFGVESGNAEMLKRIKKGITLQQVVDAVEMCNRAGMVPHASFILGLPGETPETVRDTVEFGEKLSKKGVQHGFHLLAPFPGTEVRDDINQYDLTILSNNWSEYHANRAIVETSTVNGEMLNDIVIGWEKKYSRYLGELKTRRERNQGTDEELWPLTRLEHTVLIYDLMMGNIIETHGTFDQPDGAFSETTALNELVESINPSHIPYSSVPYSPGEIKRTLDFAVKQGYLKFSTIDKKIKWEWVDYL